MIERAGCRPYGAWVLSPDYPALTRWANEWRPCGAGAGSIAESPAGMSRVRLRGSAGWRGLIAMSAGGGAALIAASLLVLRAR